VALAVAGILATVPAALAATAAEGAAAPGQWTVGAVRFEPIDPAATLTVDGSGPGGEYRGSVDVVRSGAGVAAVNEVALEQYVEGIAEVPPSWPIEAQKAQAVAARTYALHSMAGTRPAAFRAAGAHICATQSCQVYAGVGGERRDGGRRWVEAVRATAGQVLLVDGRPIRAKYSSSNGGHTVGGGAAYLPAVPDPHDAAVSPYARWQSTVTLDQLTTLFPADGQLVAVWSADAGVVLGRHLADGSVSHQVVPRWDFRTALNGSLPAPAGMPRMVPAPMFDARMTDAGTVAIDGRGYGHGVGMSQYGALGKASAGWTHGQILASYYGGVVPAVVPAEHLPATIRAAVALDRPALSVSSDAPFRVVAADGTVLAHAASGAWDVRGAAGDVTVTAPDGQRDPAALEVRDVDPPTSDTPLVVVFALSAPSVVRATAEGAGGASVDLGLRWAGEHRVELPVVTGPEDVLVMHADAGGGRVSSITVPLRLPARAAATVAAAAVGARVDAPLAPSRAPAALAAALLALGTATAVVPRLGRLR